jgi:hypothetical protein
MKHKTSYAVITGASAGIGTEFARRMAKEGFPLVLVARRTERLEELARELPTECVIITADLSKESECRRLVQELEDKKIAVFINNAGFGDCGSFLQTDVDKELNMIDVNVRAVHLLTKLMLCKMEKQQGGYLLNVASSAGLMPAGPFMATYYATKSYVTSMTRAVAEELREKNSPVYIGCLCPGPVDTEFNRVANVEFALSGITPEYCANYAVDQMKKRKVVIIPTLPMKAAMTFGRFLPQSAYIRIAAHQQKKKQSGI